MPKNPYALPDGSPKPGYGIQWFEFNQKEHERYLATLPKEERAAIETRKRDIQRRMQSEVG